MTQGSHLGDEVLSALIDGELGGLEASRAAAHQTACGVCQARAAALRGVAHMVRVGPAAIAAGPSGDLLDAMVGAALAADDWSDEREGGFDLGPDRAAVFSLRAAPSGRRRVVRAAVSAAAVAAGVGIVMAVFGHGAPPSPAVATSGLASSLGAFPDAASLGPTLRTEIVALAAGSGQNLPCHEKAAALVGDAVGTPAAFSAPLTFAGAPAEVFAYRRPQTTTGTEVAVVVKDRGCTLAARLDW